MFIPFSTLDIFNICYFRLSIKSEHMHVSYGKCEKQHLKRAEIYNIVCISVINHDKFFY